MNRIHRAATAACVLALSAVGCQPGDATKGDGPNTPPAAVGASSAGSGEIAAELDGVPITVEELDEWIKDDWFRDRASSPSKLYELRQGSLDALIAQRLVKSEAEKRGVSEEELLDLEVASLGPVSDEQVQQFFDENSHQLGGVTLEQVGPRIREFLESRRRSEAVAALRDRADVVIHLEAPRIQVAASGPSKGPADAPVTIVEFSDFQCPFCRRAVPTLDQILEKYPNDVRVVYRNMPLRSHSRARPAAQAALCADEQGQFWPYHDLLFENSRQLEDEDLARYASQLELDTEEFNRCVEEERFASRIDSDVEAGMEAGVSGTPAFFVNGVMLSGAKPAEDFYRIIDAELARQDEERSDPGGA